MLKFEVTGRCHVTHARTATLCLPHATVNTPCFMPVGTYGAVKTISVEECKSLGFELILSNTYHLALRPGAGFIQERGGLHRFMGWDGAILTDSGGYQVMSLSHLRKLDRNGVLFKSHIDGSELFIRPEDCIELQRKLGVDIAMMLDVCAPYPCTKEEAANAMALTHEWAPRNLDARADGQNVFGIVQGGIHEDLRHESLNSVCSLPFDGFAIGGVSVGEPTELQRPVVATFAPLLPHDKPRYLMGVGHPNDIIHAVKSGIDMFDCVLPTRAARHHTLYTLQGRVNLRNAKWTDHDGPVDPESVFPGLESVSAAYWRHLFVVGEPLAARFATLHNLAFYSRLMTEIRATVLTGDWESLEARYRLA